jgi:3-oxoacyl-[acyl-carrier-protein] synthase-3
MEGREVFKHAVGMITDVIEAAFDATGTGDPRTSTGWFRIRPTAASSTASAKKLGIRSGESGGHRRSARQHIGRLHPAGARMSLPPTDASRRAIWCMLEAMGGGFHLGRGAACAGDIGANAPDTELSFLCLTDRKQAQ